MLVQQNKNIFLICLGGVSVLCVSLRTKGISMCTRVYVRIYMYEHSVCVSEYRLWTYREWHKVCHRIQSRLTPGTWFRTDVGEAHLFKITLCRRDTNLSQSGSLFTGSIQSFTETLRSSHTRSGPNQNVLTFTERTNKQTNRSSLYTSDIFQVHMSLQILSSFLETCGDLWVRFRRGESLVLTLSPQRVGGDG